MIYIRKAANYCKNETQQARRINEQSSELVHLSIKLSDILEQFSHFHIIKLSVPCRQKTDRINIKNTRTAANPRCISRMADWIDSKLK